MLHAAHTHTPYLAFSFALFLFFSRPLSEFVFMQTWTRHLPRLESHPARVAQNALAYTGVVRAIPERRGLFFALSGFRAAIKSWFVLDNTVHSATGYRGTYEKKL